MGHPRPNNSIVDSSALQRFDAPIGGPVTQVTTLISKWNQNETQPLNVAILTVGGGEGRD